MHFRSIAGLAVGLAPPPMRYIAGVASRHVLPGRAHIRGPRVFCRFYSHRLQQPWTDQAHVWIAAQFLYRDIMLALGTVPFARRKKRPKMPIRPDLPTCPKKHKLRGFLIRCREAESTGWAYNSAEIIVYGGSNRLTRESCCVGGERPPSRWPRGALSSASAPHTLPCCSPWAGTTRVVP